MSCVNSRYLVDPQLLAAPSGKLSVVNLVAYSAPVGATIFLWMPTMSILPGIYAKYFGLPLTTIAAVLLIARVVDGFTDPVIGYLADRHRAQGGSYRPWVIAGGIGLVTAAYFLFSPPAQVSQAYYLVGSLAFYLAWSLGDIPHAAWGSTLAGDYHGRARVFSFRTGAVFCGLIAFFALPFLPVFASREYTPDTMRGTVYAGGAIMLVCLALMLLAPRGELLQARERDTPRAIAQSITGNKPLLLLLAAYFTGGIGYSMWFGVVFVYLDGYLGLGNKVAAIFLWGNIAGALSMALWLKLVRITSKRTAWAAGIALFIVLLASCLFVQPGSYWWISLLLIGGAYVSFACQTMVAAAVLGDIADYGQLKFRRNRGAIYFALLALSYKVTSGLGAGLSLWIAGHFGFDATTSTQTETGIFGLRLAFIFVPAIFVLISFALIFLTPISEARHRVIRRWIERRAV